MLPETIAARIKPGWMCRPDDHPDSWTLHEPASDLTCRFTLGAPASAGLCPADLESNDRLWSGGRLQVDLYHSARSLRAHVDAQEANLEINYLCRYACRHCFQSLVPAQHDRAAPEPAALWAAAHRLLAARPLEISITGGDIFLHPAIWDLLDFFEQRAPRLTLRLLVNGGALDPDDAGVRARLSRLAGRRLIVKSDFFGHTAELHDGFTRIPGSFARLVAIAEFLRGAGIACLPAAALTRLNFDHRFELVNFLYNLTGNSFTVSSIIYPSDWRTPAALAELRLSPGQHAELLDEKFFSPLVAEYHTFEPQCAGDCQFAVASASGAAWGCSFLKLDAQNGGAGAAAPLLPVLEAWRRQAVQRAVFAECPSCPAAPTCRKCPSFLAAGQTGDDYCSLSRQAWPWLARRVDDALRHGFQFIHPVATGIPACRVPPAAASALARGAA